MGGCSRDDGGRVVSEQVELSGPRRSFHRRHPSTGRQVAVAPFDHPLCHGEWDQHDPTSRHRAGRSVEHRSGPGCRRRRRRDPVHVSRHRRMAATDGTSRLRQLGDHPAADGRCPGGLTDNGDAGWRRVVDAQADAAAGGPARGAGGIGDAICRRHGSGHRGRKPAAEPGRHRDPDGVGAGENCVCPWCGACRRRIDNHQPTRVSRPHRAVVRGDGAGQAGGGNDLPHLPGPSACVRLCDPRRSLVRGVPVGRGSHHRWSHGGHAEHLAEPGADRFSPGSRTDGCCRSTPR